MARMKTKAKDADGPVSHPRTYHSLKELAKDYRMADLEGQVAGSDIASQATDLARQIVSAAAEHHLKLSAERV